MRYFSFTTRQTVVQSISQHGSFLGVSKPSRILSIRFPHFYTIGPTTRISQEPVTSAR